MRVGPESQYFSGAAREVKMAGGEDVLVLANILLRHVDNQIFAGKGEVGAAAYRLRNKQFSRVCE